MFSNCHCSIPTWRERTEATYKRHLQEYADREIDVLLLGDSMFERFRTTGKCDWSQNPKIWNAGVGGDRTEHVLWRLEQGLLQHTKPKKIILMIGTNNVPFDTPKDIYDGILSIINEIKQRSPLSKLILLAMIPRNPGVYHLADKIKTTLKEVNQKLSKLHFPDYYDFTDIFLDKTHLYSDHVHLNEAGYRVWVQQLQQIV